MGDYLACIAVIIAVVSLGPIYLEYVCDIADRKLTTGKGRTFNVILIIGIVIVTVAAIVSDVVVRKSLRIFLIMVFLLLMAEVIFIWIYFENFAKIAKTRRPFG